MKTHRKPAVAGMFYQNNPEKLNRDVKSYITASKRRSHQKVKFIIVPHAGYVYSGKIAGESFAELLPSDYDRVILLGPSHRYSFEGLAESEEAYWDLPTGNVKIEFVDKPEVLKEYRYHQSEHCLEVQLPFLRYLLPNASYSPILISGSYQQAEPLADFLYGLDDERTLWVISSDFNHVGPNFQHFPEQYGFGSGESMDLQAIEYIKAGDTNGLVAFMEKTDATICGALPILTAMHLIHGMKRPHFLFKRYDCSGNQTGDINSVGYASLYS